MSRKTFLNQKLGKQTTHRQSLSKLKPQFDRRTSQQRSLERLPKLREKHKG
jgi:hypothetical protein